MELRINRVRIKRSRPVCTKHEISNSIFNLARLLCITHLLLVYSGMFSIFKLFLKVRLIRYHLSDKAIYGNLTWGAAWRLESGRTYPQVVVCIFFVYRSEHPWICGRCVMDTGGVCFLPIGTQTIKLTNRLSSTAVSSCITWIPVAPVFLTHWRNWVQWIGFSILQDAEIQFVESLHKN